MMQTDRLLKIFHWIVFGNYWVSAGSVAMYAVACSVLMIEYSWLWAAALFFGTLTAYTYHRVGPGVAYSPSSTGGVRRNWIAENLQALRIQMILSGILSTVLFALLCTIEQWAFLIPAAFIAVIYILPVIPQGGKWIRLRELPFFKIFIIAAVWIVLSILPLVPEMSPLPQNSSLQFLLAQRLLFLLAVTIPFDLRDIEIDRLRGIKTVATALGAVRSIQISHLLLVFSAIVCWLAYQLQVWNAAQALSLAVSSASTAILIARIKPDSDEMIFSFWLEGSMLDQLFWVQMFV